MTVRRNTKQRQIVLDEVRSRCDHPTTEQIYESIHKVSPDISMGTVYRNLSILSEEGQVLAIRLPGADRFDLRTDPHNHLMCGGCGQVKDIDIPYDDSLNGTFSADGFYIQDHQTIYIGLCPECAAKSEKKMEEIL